MKRVLAALLLFAGPVNAQVSSTAAPVANSSVEVGYKPGCAGGSV